jgi:hypothetical protein
MTNNKSAGARYDYNKNSSYVMKIEDLGVLQSLRNTQEIKSEILIAMIRLYVIIDDKIKKDMNVILRDTLDFNSKFNIGFDIIKLAGIVAEIVGQQIPVPNNLRIINLLGITLEEQASMKILITKTEKNRRSNGKRSELSKVHKFVKNDFLKKDIARLHAAGKTIDEIAIDVKKSRSTVYRYLK